MGKHDIEKRLGHVEEQTSPGNLESIAKCNTSSKEDELRLKALLEVAYECEKETIEKDLSDHEHRVRTLDSGSLFNGGKVSKDEANELIEDPAFRKRVCPYFYDKMLDKAAPDKDGVILF